MSNNESCYYRFSTSKLSKHFIDNDPAFNILYPKRPTQEDKQDLAILKQEAVRL